jgi:hypothetical protein
MAAAPSHKVFRWRAAALAAFCLACGAAHAQRAALTNGMTMAQPTHGPAVLSPLPAMPPTPTNAHGVVNTLAIALPTTPTVTAAGTITIAPSIAARLNGTVSLAGGMVTPGVVFTMATAGPGSFMIVGPAGTAKPVAALAAKTALDHLINTSQIVEAQSAAIVSGSVVLSGGQ